MKRARRLAALGVIMLVAATPARAEVRITFDDGRVTLDARNASLREILLEWAAVGQTQILNVEKLSGAPLTLRLEDVPEREALDRLLRTLPGYVVAGRRDVGPSSFTRIVLLVASSVTAATVSPAALGRAPRTNGLPRGLQAIPPELEALPGGDLRKQLPVDPDADDQASGDSRPAPTTSATPGVIIGAPQ